MSSVQEHSMLTFAPPSAFARDIAHRVRASMAETGDHRFGDKALWMRVSALAVFGLTAYGLLLSGAAGRFGDLVCIAIAAFCAFILIVQLGHDASHGSVSPRRWVNRITLFVTFSILGVDGLLWRDRHIRLHHQVTNLPGTGIDADSTVLVRLAPDKAWHWWHRLQPLYAPLLFAIGHLSLAWVEDFATLRALRHAGRREFLGWRPVATLLCGKAVHLILFVGLPGLLLKPNVFALALGYILASSLVAVCFVLLVIGTHVSALAAFPQPDAFGRVPHDWATHQVLTSIDWAPTSPVAVLASGGANAHVAHHLFPGYHHRHMARISRIIAEVAPRHGLPHLVTSFGGMVLGLWHHLVLLSRPTPLGPYSHSIVPGGFEVTS